MTVTATTRTAPSCTRAPIITTAAVGQLADILDRMPLVLPEDRWGAASLDQ